MVMDVSLILEWYIGLFPVFQLSLYMESCKCGKSSQQILMFAIDKIVNALDQHLVVCAAFLDLKKAFDSLDHVILLQRLEYMGVEELKWFTDYLSDRIQRVKHGCSYSNWRPVLGVYLKAVLWDLYCF